jgi:hypothetical protein
MESALDVPAPGWSRLESQPPLAVSSHVIRVTRPDNAASIRAIPQRLLRERFRTIYALGLQPTSVGSAEALGGLLRYEP